MTTAVFKPGATEVEDSQFFNDKKLTTAIIPEGIGYISMYAFSGCVNLTELVIPATVKVIDVSAFRGCIGLETVIIPDGVISIGNTAFYECENIHTLIIPKTILCISCNAFSRCNKITRVWNKSNTNIYRQLDMDLFNQLTLSVLIGPGIPTLSKLKQWTFARHFISPKPPTRPQRNLATLVLYYQDLPLELCFIVFTYIA
jgi:hypothetical protein